MSEGFIGSIVEDASLPWLEALAYRVPHGPDVAAGKPWAKFSDPSYRDVMLERRLRQALVRLTTDRALTLEHALRKLTWKDAASRVAYDSSYAGRPD